MTSSPTHGRRATTVGRGDRSIWYYLGISLSAALLVAVAALAVVIIVIPKVTGSIPMTVLTSSMEPSLPPGTLIIVKPIDPADIVIGDAITYQITSGEHAVITHRVIAIETSTDGSRTFILKGDNNSDADPDPILPLQVQGKVWYSVPYLGWVNNLFGGPNRDWIVPALAIALFGYAGFTVASAVASRLRRKRSASTDVPTESSAGQLGARDLP